MHSYQRALKIFWWTLAGIFTATFIVGFNSPIIPGDAGLSKHPHLFALTAAAVCGSLLALLIYFKLYKDDGRAGDLGSDSGWATLMVICAFGCAFCLGAEVAFVLDFFF